MLEDAIPIVSVIMANFNAGHYATDAVTSVLRQTLSSLELIFSDDGSTDESLALAAAAAGNDPRFTLLRCDAQTGPGAARNRALSMARGKWIAIVDSDDWLHPSRLEWLVQAAERDKAEIAADDLLVFYTDGSRPAHPHLMGAHAASPSWINEKAYLESDLAKPHTAPLGYLKPIIRRSLLETSGGYDESLRNGEDFDLVLRLLRDGRGLRLYPEPLYFYRKHSKSISHRRSAEQVAAMIAAQDRLFGASPTDDNLARALKLRRKALQQEIAFCGFVDALKAKRLGLAFSSAAKNPALIWQLREALWNRIQELLSPPQDKSASNPLAVVVSSQRVVGETSGSAVYLLSLARAVRQSGFRVAFLGVSPKLFGRWPILRLHQSMNVFESVRVHGGLKIGRFIIALDIATYGSALRALLQIVLNRLGLTRISVSRSSEYSVTAPLQRSDKLFAARHALGRADLVLCDYAPLAPVIPFVSAGRAPSMIVMHDLMSAHQATLEAQGAPSHFSMSAQEEFALLATADAVLAIQPEEEGVVRAALPDHVKVILAPCPMTPRTLTPALGEGFEILFVGSNTIANRHALAWFVDACWPTVLSKLPQARLLIAGAVGRGCGPIHNAVKLGVVDDLSAVYRRAALVIAPIRAGSGLKIKLVEAMAEGKAIVATTIATRGVERLVNDAVRTADDPALFAQAVVELLQNSEQRSALCVRALACVTEHFSAEACYRELMDYVAPIAAAGVAKIGAPPPAPVTDARLTAATRAT